MVDTPGPEDKAHVAESGAPVPGVAETTEKIKQPGPWERFQNWRNRRAEKSAAEREQNAKLAEQNAATAQAEAEARRLDAQSRAEQVKIDRIAAEERKEAARKTAAAEKLAAQQKKAAEKLAAEQEKAAARLARQAEKKANPGLFRKAGKGVGELAAFEGKAIKETAGWLTYKPVRAVWRAAKSVVEHPASKPIAIGAATVAGVIGVKEWQDKRNEQAAMEQLATAQVLSQDIADKEARIAEITRQRAAAQASVANPDAASNHVARLEKAAAEQSQSPAVSSLSA